MYQLLGSIFGFPVLSGGTSASLQNQAATNNMVAVAAMMNRNYPAMYLEPGIFWTRDGKDRHRVVIRRERQYVMPDLLMYAQAASPSPALPPWLTQQSFNIGVSP